FYDFVNFDDDMVGIAVGDVTGKGVPAALYMARLLSDFRQYAYFSKKPASVLKSVNGPLVERSRRGMFVTLQYGILDSRTGKFTYSNAGHIPFIRVSLNKKIELLNGAKTIPLGIDSNLKPLETSTQLEHGDFVVLITDGIIEAKNPAGDAYSLDRTLRLLQKRMNGAGVVVEALINDVQTFAENRDQHDDLTVLAIQWN
ncbi:MAG: PP2C family protein-serine/threonine phosphatase, partial [bacterium]